VLFLLLGLVFGVTMAATILIAQYVGAQNMDAAKRVVGTSATFFAGLALLFCVIGLVFSKPILQLMRTPPEALPLALDYIRVMFYSLPFGYFYFYVMAALRGTGDSKTPFYFLLLSVALDIVLNPVFIFGLGIAPRLGIAGAAWATFVSQAVSLAAMVYFIYRRRHPLALRRVDTHLLKPDFAIVRTLLLKGMPMGAQMIVLSFALVATFTLVNRYGERTTAAFAAAMQLWAYVQMPALALGAAVSSMVAQNIGAQRWDRVGAIAKSGVLFNFVASGVPVLLLYVFSEPALSLFLPDDAKALEIARHINDVVLWSFPMFGVSMVLSGVVRAAGAVIAPLVILVIALWIVRLPLSWALMPSWQADGIWWSYAASGVLAMLFSMAYYRYGGWRAARMVPNAG
jgi:putative MATE family efflux protein